ncbi:hypothetical protein [Vreelandella profundi]|uniref:hypothetical protein n=1 Tax=Vreelandella profundi TaxID=2852117 RepID=UPI001F438210|nr:hypothetical protein [Halomonas profundi]
MSEDMKCATDRDIHDLLLSNQQKFTPKVLRELAFSRNVICSDVSEKKKLADYLSVITHDHYDLDELIEKRESKARREKSTFETYKVSLEGDEVKEILGKLRETYSEDSNKDFKFTQTSSTSFKAAYSYIDMLYSKTRFTQRQHYKAEISIDVKDNELQVRMPAGLRETDFTDVFQKKMQESIYLPVVRESISLENIRAPELRSQFFLKLISSIEGLRFKGVFKVKVSSKHLIPDVFDDAAFDNEDEENEKTNGEDKNSEDSPAMLQAIHRMILDGENIESSSEYQDLTKSGYFINSISWIATENVSPYTQYFMEVGFSDGDTCKNFRYSLKGVKNVKGGFYNKSVRPPSENNTLWFNEAIELVSRTILEEITTKKYRENDDG